MANGLPSNFSVKEDAINLTPLDEGKTEPLGGTGQVVFKTYSFSTKVWNRGSSFTFYYTIKSNWYTSLPVTIECRIGEIGEHHGFQTEFFGAKQHVITPYSTIRSSFTLQAAYTSVGLKYIYLIIRDTILPLIIYEDRWLGNQYVQRYEWTSDPDPDGYGSQYDDLFHHKQYWSITLQAAQFCDDTITRYWTAYWINYNTHYRMRYDDQDLALYYAFSDIYLIKWGNWWGVCDEFAIAFTSMCRAMNIHSRFLDVKAIDPGERHGAAEIWDGSQWVHADPTWLAFNDEWVYYRAGWREVYVSICHNADDSRHTSPTDPDGDQILTWSPDQTDILLKSLGKYWGY